MYEQRRREEVRNTRLLTTLLVTVAFLIAGLILIYNRNGFMAITEIQGEIQEIRAANDSLSREIDSLTNVIHLLENDSLYMEKGSVKSSAGAGRTSS